MLQQFVFALWHLQWQQPLQELHGAGQHGAGHGAGQQGAAHGAGQQGF